MFLPEPVTLIVFGSWLLGDAVEGYKWKYDSKDVNPPVHYTYDPAYFNLGDENGCGDTRDGPCTEPLKPISIIDPSKGHMGCQTCEGEDHGMYTQAIADEALTDAMEIAASEAV